ncbi:Ig-like domain-containing protein [Vibrio neptunius]|uniref:Ig-like domain-containing protein n=2 Tax=Vibrio neptunius TaxID=170651 RepID=A0ABS2ZXM7_9VIBR|nr:Ig-like domain-containing protein [Vibrio neptunius]MBN3551538.1 Ig-like domain-containing protein [Vibrio neptunius]MBN3577016.1 Ig-like domain-containing protein [Vibrio neptunius]MCH9870680.1 Ig-like domain-containing protein [Vibrio neptunius]
MFAAMGYYSDGSSRQITDLSINNWHSSEDTLASFEQPGVLVGKIPGTVRIHASKDGITSNTMSIGVTDAVLTSIAVTPSSPSIAKGQMQPLLATALYSDGSSFDVSDSVTWASEETTIATVTSEGILLGVEVGRTTVNAMKEGIISNTVDVNVTNAVMTSILVTPSSVSLAIGQTQPLVTTAIYSDGSSTDISGSVTWRSTDTTTATVTQTGTLLGVQVGTTNITATIEGISSNTVTVEVTDAVITSLNVTPASISLAKGQTQTLVATATFSDGTSSDLSDSVSWQPVNTAIATVTPKGTLRGIEVGNTTVTATINHISSNTVNVEVTDAVITSLDVTPASVSIAKGQTQTLIAMATYSDGSNVDTSDSVTWASDQTTIAPVTPDGMLMGNQVGSADVTATIDGISSNRVSVEITNAVITSLDVTPTSVAIAKGQTKSLVAMATYSDGSYVDITDSVTWLPAEPNIANVTPQGLLSSHEVGSTSVSAVKDEVTSNQVIVDVTSAIVTSIELTPNPAFVVKDLSRPLVATATYSDGSASNVSTSVTWTSIDTDVATVAPLGQLTGIEVGQTTVSAFKDGITSQTLSVNVCDQAVSCNIEVFDTGAGKLFTSTPSAVYLDSIGGSPNVGVYNDQNGSYYRFNWPHANQLCKRYNRMLLAGRTNWRLTTKNELLDDLYGIYGNMYNARSWPANKVSYWSSDVSVGAGGATRYISARLNVASYAVGPATMRQYVSCVSEP